MTPTRRTATRGGAWILLCAVLLLGGVAVGAVTGHPGATASVQSASLAPDVEPIDEPAFIVTVDENGTAEFALRSTFNLDDEDAEDAFEALRESEEDRDAFAATFEGQMSALVEDASEVAEREMSVSNASVTFETVGDVGVVTATLSWSGLAAATGDQLIVTEPFASDFEPDRAFHLRFPADYEVVSATPEPDQHDSDHVFWEAQTNLGGFEVVAATDEVADVDIDDADDTDEPAPDDADDDGHGFGPLIALAGLLSLMVFLARR